MPFKKIIRNPKTTRVANFSNLSTQMQQRRPKEERSS
jgi:hypothetical protein